MRASLKMTFSGFHWIYFLFSSNIVNIKSKSFTNMLNAWKDQRKVAPFSLHVSVVRYSGCPVCFLPWKSSVRHQGHHHFSLLYLIFSHHYISFFLINFFLIFCENHFWWKVLIKPAREESARAFFWQTVRPQWEGEDFLTGQLNFFTETAATPERKVEKSFPRWEINRHAEG